MQKMIYGFKYRDAKWLGLKRYIGKPCKHGHHEGRQTVNRACPVCNRKHMRHYYQENRETAIEYARSYYQENKEALLKSRRRYREENHEAVLKGKRRHYCKNREAILESRRQHYQENREAKLEHRRRYRQNNPEKVAAHDAKRRAIERNALVPGEDNRAFEECRLVAEMLELEYGMPFHVDHILPLAAGGVHAGLNFQVISARDNQHKHAKTDFNDYQDPRWVHPEAQWQL